MLNYGEYGEYGFLCVKLTCVGNELTISSPGLQLSTRSARRIASFDRGRRPAATLPGLSWIVIR